MQKRIEDEDSDDCFGGFRRMQTMPVKSVLPDKTDNLDFDDIQSCHISGMTSSIKESTPAKTQLEMDIEEVLAE